MAEMKDIINKAIQGDRNAFIELCNAKGKNVVYLCIKAMGNIQDGEDVAQEVFIGMQKGIRSLKNPQAFDSWMYAIIRNSCRKLRRSDMKNSGNLPISDFEDFIIEDKTDYLPQDILEVSEKREKLLSSIDAMPDTMRMCVILFYYEGLSQAEIADALAISVNTVKSSLQRAKAKMREEIIELEPEYGKTTSMPSVLMGTLFTQEANAIVTTFVVESCTKAAIALIPTAVVGASAVAATSAVTAKAVAAVIAATSVLLVGVSLTVSTVSGNNPISSNPSFVSAVESAPQRTINAEETMIEDITSSEDAFVPAPSLPVQSETESEGAEQSSSKPETTEKIQYTINGAVLIKDNDANDLPIESDLLKEIRITLVKNNTTIAQTYTNEKGLYEFQNLSLEKGTYKIECSFLSNYRTGFIENNIQIDLANQEKMEVPNIYISTIAPSIFLTTRDEKGKINRTNPSKVELSISGTIKTSYTLYVYKEDGTEPMVQGDIDAISGFLQSNPSKGKYTIKAIVMDVAKNTVQDQVDFYIV